jgi:hypothetical protein
MHPSTELQPWCQDEAKVAPGRHAALLLDQAGWHMSDRLAVPSGAVADVVETGVA